ncbi:unnamed protein product [Closterium sp. NIES-65]|nr:unnamed protein product [Closterium sp. NIES-65]
MRAYLVRKAKAVGLFPFQAKAVGLFPFQAKAVGLFPVQAKAVGLFPFQAKAVGSFPFQAKAVGLFPFKAKAVGVFHFQACLRSKQGREEYFQLLNKSERKPARQPVRQQREGDSQPPPLFTAVAAAAASGESFVLDVPLRRTTAAAAATNAATEAATAGYTPAAAATTGAARLQAQGRRRRQRTVIIGPVSLQRAAVTAGYQLSQKRPKGPCSMWFKRVFIVRVKSAADFAARASLPCTATVILHLQKDLMLPKGVIFGRQQSCTILMSAKWPGYTVTGGNHMYPVLRVWNTSNFMSLNVNYRLPVTESSPECTIVPELGKGVTCPAISIHRSFGVQIGKRTPLTGQGVAELGKGVAELGKGVAELGKGVAELGKGVAELGKGVAELGKGVAELGKGVAELGKEWQSWAREWQSWAREWQSWARSGRAGQGSGRAGQGVAELGKGVAELIKGVAELGKEWQSRARSGGAGQGVAELGKGVAELGKEWQSWAREWQSWAREWQSWAREWQSWAREWQSWARSGRAGQGMAELGKGVAELGKEAGQGVAELGKGVAELDRDWQSWARSGRARQGVAEPGKEWRAPRRTPHLSTCLHSHPHSLSFPSPHSTVFGPVGVQWSMAMPRAARLTNAHWSGFSLFFSSHTSSQAPACLQATPYPVFLSPPQGNIFGRVDVLHSMDVRLDSLSVTGVASFIKSPGVIRVALCGYEPGLLKSNVVISNNERSSGHSNNKQQHPWLHLLITMLFPALSLNPLPPLSLLEGVNTPVVLHRGAEGIAVTSIYIHDHWVNTPILLHWRAVGVTVRNNYVRDFIFAGIKCGADVHYSFACMLSRINSNLVVSSGRNLNGDHDSAGIYFYTHWFSPGNSALCNYVFNGDHCYYLDHCTSGVLVRGGACVNTYDGMKVNNGKR